MKKLLTFGIACLALFGANPVHAVIGMIDPPVSDKVPSTVNPFVDNLTVTLTVPDGQEILYDINGGGEFDITTALLYTGPLYLTGNSVIRAVAHMPGDTSNPAEWVYVKNLPPTVAFTAPATGTDLDRGTSVTLIATVTDPDATAPYTTVFSRKGAEEVSWTPLSGSRNTNGNLTVAVNGTFPLGANQFRVIGADAKGLADTAFIDVTVSLPPNVPPTVIITLPANNAVIQLPASITINADAEDPDGAIQKVEFYATPTGGTAVLIGSADLVAPYTASYANPPAGTYTLTAIAYDNATTTTTSAAVNVTVLSKPNAFPTARISFPENGKTYYAPFIDSVRAVTSDPDGDATVKQVVFRNRNVVENVDNTPISTWAYLKTYPVGTYKMTATATDNKGDSTISDTVTFTVANNQAPIAKAGADVALLWPANVVALDGGTSTDPEGFALKYEWTGPAGVTFTNANTATASATFSAPGVDTLTLKVTDSGTPPLTASDQIIITVNSKAAITSLLTASATIATPFSYQILGSGYPAPTFEVTANPTWLTFNSATGVLSGTPTATGPVPVNLTAKNTSGQETKVLVISVSDSLYKPTITSPLTATAKLSQAFTYTILATGNPSPTFSVSTLPAGLTLAANTGVISGIPTVSGIYSINLTATNSKGTNTKTLSLTINADPKITLDLPVEMSVQEKTRAVFRVTATGFPAVTYQWQYRAGTSGAMTNVGTNSPTYTIDPTTTASAGYYQVVVIAAGPFVVSRMCHLKITPAPIPIRITANPTPLTVVVGDSVRFTAKATGEGKLLYQWFRGTTAVTSPASEKDFVFVIPAAGANDGGLFRARVTSSAYPDTTKPEGLAYSDTARLIVQLPKLPKPKANPAGGPFWPSTQVSLSNDTAGTQIYYTLDGSDPTQGSTAYTGTPIFLDVTKTIRARSYKNGFRASDITTENYNRTAPDKVVKPVISPPAPTFSVAMKCTLTTATTGATIYYTLDGSSPLTGNPAVFNGFISLNQTTTIIAVAKKSGMQDSDTLKMTYTREAISSKVITPTISPAGNDFTGNIMVTLYCATDGATIWYTTDGSAPDTSSTRTAYIVGAPITLTKTTNLRAIATKQNFLASDMVAQTYKLIPGPITASPLPDIIFDSTVTVNLTALPAGATIRYTTENEMPTEESSVFPAAGLPLTATTKISAIAVMDGVSSTVYSFSYTRKGGQLATPTPITAGNLSTFKDVIYVGLTSTPNSAIYYTLNGDIPNTSSDRYTAPFMIDSTVTLQAVAVQNGYTNSKILVATYTLVPEMPTASPSGGSFPTTKHVKLSCSSKRVKFYYTTDGMDPTPTEQLEYKPGDSITIASTSMLKAIAVAGNMASPMLVENYEIFGVKDFTLAPGKVIFLEGGYSLRSPEDQSATVLVRLANATQLNIDGFDGVQYVIYLELDAQDALAGLEFPKLDFAKSSLDKRSMYKLDLSQKIYFISGADNVTLSQPGTYFMGIDISPPVIGYLAESFGEKDSTRVSFLVEDNVSNLSYDVKRNDNPALGLSQQFLFAGQGLSFNLKHPTGSLKPLNFQLTVTDYKTASFYPPDPGTSLSLSQRMGAIKGPDAWFIGSATSAFDFISIPLALDPPLTVADLRNANPGAGLEGVAWNHGLSKYEPINGSETLRPGQGYWIGARSRVASLSVASATTLPSGKGSYSVNLKNGWNQIGNPHLEELYWPFSRNLGDAAYKTFAIKSLWEYVPGIYDFTESESLKPWRGYYVYNYLQDTTVILSPRPITVWAMKKSGADAARIRLSLGWGPTRSLQLGADHLSADGLGREDEFSLPRHNQGVYLRALREGSGLVSDWVRLRPDGIQEWKVAMEGSGDSLPPLRILDQELPAGYETWAVSPSRSMKFRLEAGLSVPASGLAKDTLLVYSGPREKMARFHLLDNLSVTAPSLDLRVSARNGGFNVQMALPTKARIRAVVWSLSGVRQGEFALGPLSEGSYMFTFAGDFHNRPARLVPGIYFLSLEIQGTGLRTRLTRKIVLPD